MLFLNFTLNKTSQIAIPLHWAFELVAVPKTSTPNLTFIVLALGCPHTLLKPVTR